MKLRNDDDNEVVQYPRHPFHQNNSEPIKTGGIADVHSENRKAVTFVQREIEENRIMKFHIYARLFNEP